MTTEFNTLWIVGASSGIGKALVKQFDREGRTLFISARSVKDLAALAQRCRGRVIPVVVDITDERAVLSAVEQVAGDSATLDLLIINAGTCEYIDAGNIDQRAIERVVATNFTGATRVVAAALPLLRRNRAKGDRKKLVFTSSSATYLPLPRAGVYGGSKAALRYFAECLRLDLQHENIEVQIVSPGFVRTPLTDRNDFSMPFILDADDAARRMAAGVSGRQFDVQFPRRLTWLLNAIRCVPRKLREKMLGKLSRHSAVSGHP